MAVVTIATGSIAAQTQFTARCANVYNGIPYVCVRDEGASAKLHMYKSADGASSWSEVNSASAPSTLASTVRAFSTTMSSAGMIYVAHFSAAGTLSVAKFNAATELWTTAISGTATTTADSFNNIRIGLRSDGDVLVTYTKSGDIYYSRWEGSSWTSDVVVYTGNTDVVIDAVMDESDFFTIFFLEAVQNDVSMITVSSANSLGSVIDIDASASANTGVCVSNVYNVSGTDKITLGWIDTSNDGTESEITLELASPTVATNTHVTPTTVSNPLTFGSIATHKSAKTGLRYFVWNHLATDIWLDKTATTTWGTDRSYKTGLTISNPVQIIELSNGLLLIYEDGETTVKCDFIEYVTAAPLATATVAGVAPTITGPVQAVVVPLATATVGGLASTQIVTAKPPIATVAATAPTSTQRALVAVTLATATATALTSVVLGTAQFVLAPVAAATMTALAPVVLGTAQFVIVPVAAATMTALTSVLVGTVIAPLATIAASALAPTMQAKQSVPLATLQVTALDALIQAIQRVDVGVVTLTGLAPFVSGNTELISVPTASSLVDALTPTLRALVAPNSANVVIDGIAPVVITTGGTTFVFPPTAGVQVDALTSITRAIVAVTAASVVSDALGVDVRLIAKPPIAAASASSLPATVLFVANVPLANALADALDPTVVAVVHVAVGDVAVAGQTPQTIYLHSIHVPVAGVAMDAPQSTLLAIVDAPTASIVAGGEFVDVLQRRLYQHIVATTTPRGIAALTASLFDQASTTNGRHNVIAITGLPGDIESTSAPRDVRATSTTRVRR